MKWLDRSESLYVEDRRECSIYNVDPKDIVSLKKNNSKNQKRLLDSANVEERKKIESEILHTSNLILEYYKKKTQLYTCTQMVAMKSWIKRDISFWKRR